MSNVADKARAVASTIEVKKDGLRQTQDGLWKITLTAADLPQWVITARPGTRIVAALVEVGDDEEPVSHKVPAPAVSGERPATVAGPGRDAAREQSSRAYHEDDAMGQARRRAGMLCGDPAFWRWQEKMMKFAPGRIGDKDTSADFLRLAIDVPSRTDIGSDERAFQAFLDLEFQYRGHAEIRG